MTFTNRTYTISMPGFVRGLALALAAALVLSAVPDERANAMSLITPGASPAKAAADGLIQVRGGFHGFHGGGFHGGGFHGGGFHGGGFHGFRGGGFHGGGFHGFHGGGYRYGGFRRYGGFHRHGGYYGGYRFAHVHHRRFYGAYYPYYSYYPRCRIIWTYYGPRRVCGYRHWHRWHHWRRHSW